MSESRKSLISGDRLTVDAWTDDESKPCAGRMLGMGRSATYKAIRSGEIPSIRLGRRILVSVAVLHRMLGMDGAGAAGQDHQGFARLG